MSTLAHLVEHETAEVLRRWTHALESPGRELLTPLLPTVLGALGDALRGRPEVKWLPVRPECDMEAVMRAYERLQTCLLELAAARGLGLQPAEVLTLTRFVTRGLNEAVEQRARIEAEARLRAERARLRVEERLRLATESTGVGSWELLLDTRTLVADERVLRLLGLPSGQSPPVEETLRHVLAEDQVLVREALARAMAGEGGGRYAVDYRMRTPEGEERWLAARGQVFFGGGGRAERFVGTLVDLTARRRAEEALRLSEEYLRRVVEATGAGTWELELRGNRVTADERMLGLFGMASAKDVSLEDVLLGIHPADRERVAGAIQAALRGEEGGRYMQEYRTLGADGRERWVESRGHAFFSSSGQAERFLGTGVDITERRREANERERLALLVERSNELIGLVTPAAQPLYYNEAGRRMLGLGRLEESLRPSFFSLVAPQDREHLVHILALVQREGAWEGVLNLRHQRSGELIPLHCHAFEVRDRRTGELLCVATIARDLREELRRREEEKQRSDFEQQLIGIVSHDLRNPLSTILLGAASLLRREDLDPRTARAVLRMQSSAERATRMVRDLLDFTQARLGGGITVRTQPLDLREAVHQVLEEVQGEYVERDFREESEGDTRGEWDPDRITQLLINLVSNAVKYSPGDSTVRVRTRGEADAVVLEVHNTGEPMPPELISRLFQPMQRATPGMDKATRSVGLGLYIVHHLVRAHGGEVEVSSSLEEGTTFRVHLPREARLPQA